MVQTFVALIRGINVGGHKRVKMAEVKSACEQRGLRDVRTLLQSGNIIFRSGRADRARIALLIEGVLGVDAKVILRTATELRRAIDENPMKEQAGQTPSAFVVMFLSEKPAAAAMRLLREAWSGPEEMHLRGAELYIHYGAGMGTSKLTNVLIERKLGVTGTARNWNTVTRLGELATSR